MRRMMKRTAAVAVSTKPFGQWDKTALIQYARDKGIPAHKGWKAETIIGKLKEQPSA